MPNSTVLFSAILPKYDTNFLHEIDTVNWLVAKSANQIGFAFISHNNFARNGRINNSLICKDGIHPSFRGVAQLAMDYKR